MSKRTKTNSLSIIAPVVGILLFTASLLFAPVSVKRLRKSLIKKQRSHKQKQTLAVKVRRNLKKLSW